MSQIATPISSRGRLSRFQIGILIFIVGCGAFLRFFRIGHSSLWIDEVWSIEISTGRGSLHDHLATGILRRDQPEITTLAHAPPWWRIASALSGVPYPPIYHFLLHGWMDFFGNSEAGVRSLSALASLAAIAVFFDLCWWLHGPRVALLAAGIMAFAGAQIDYAQEARSYALVILLSLCCGDAVVRMEKLGVSKRRLAAFAGFSAALVLTHYLGIGVPLALAMYGWIRFDGRDRLKIPIAMFAAAGAVLLVWGIPLYHQYHSLNSMSPTFLRERLPIHGELTYRRVVGLPAEFLVGENVGEAMAGPLVLAIAVICMAIPVLRVFWRRDMLFWVCWIAGTIGLIVGLDLAHGSTLSGYLRYTIHASPAIYAMIAAYDWPRRKLLRDMAPIFALILLAQATVVRLADGPTPKEDWRQMVSFLNRAATDGEPVVFYNPDPWLTPGMWYACCQYYSLDPRHPWMLLENPADATALAELKEHDSLLLFGLSPSAEGESYLPGWKAEPVAYQNSAGVVCRMRRSE